MGKRFDIITKRVIYRSDRAEMRTFLPPRYHQVLEIGCDEGEFAAAPDAGTWGVEPVAEAAAIAAPRLHKVLVGTFDTVRERCHAVISILSFATT